MKKVRKGPFNVIYVNSETGHKLNKMTKKTSIISKKARLDKIEEGPNGF